ncbi:MAG: hypothetical protein MUF87_16940 [Anaerolineae bacterium]|nr:hypothetical protein [Anaerolineae bacterium]
MNLSNHHNTNWYDFLRHKVNSFIKWDLVRFFHDNPHTRDTAENIAKYISRDTKVVERELQGLVMAGVIDQEHLPQTELYALCDDAAIRALIDDFMIACHDREFRVQAIQQVIQGMQFTPRHDF